METEAVYGAAGVAGVLWALWEKIQSASSARENDRLKRAKEEEAEARKRTAEWVAMHVTERDRALQRLDEQQKDHLASREMAAKLQATVDAQQREIADLRRRLDECNQCPQ